MDALVAPTFAFKTKRDSPLSHVSYLVRWWVFVWVWLGCVCVCVLIDVSTCMIQITNWFVALWTSTATFFLRCLPQSCVSTAGLLMLLQRFSMTCGKSNGLIKMAGPACRDMLFGLAFLFTETDVGGQFDIVWDCGMHFSKQLLPHNLRTISITISRDGQLDFTALKQVAMGENSHGRVAAKAWHKALCCDTSGNWSCHMHVMDFARVCVSKVCLGW